MDLIIGAATEVPTATDELLPPEPSPPLDGEVLDKEDDLPAPAVQTIQRKCISIFGTTPSRGEGPWQDGTEWERWTIGPGGKDAHGWERLYEIHAIWPPDFRDYLNDLSKVEAPRKVITVPQPGNAGETWMGAIDRWHRMHNLPPGTLEGKFLAVERFPRERIMAKFFRGMWFSSTISWCIAHAIEEGATDIGLWGIDLESGEEYQSQFSGAAHLMDLARALNINIHLPRDCGLLRDIAPYPDRYETLLALTLEKKHKYISQMLGNMEPQFEAGKAQMHRLEGQCMLLRELGADAAKVSEREQALMNQNMAVGQLACQINQLKGELGSTAFYRKMFVWGLVDPEEYISAVI